MQVLIRPIEPNDNKVLAIIIRAAFEEHDAPKQGTVYSDPTTDDLATLFESSNAVLWVAIVNGVIAGCCGIYPTPNLPVGYAELVKFYFDKKYRGQGIAFQLFEKSIASAKELGYNNIYIESLPHYKKAIAMYEKYGFTYLPQPLGNSGHTSCTIWMEKGL
jgi:putative acetyltransferase